MQWVESEAASTCAVLLAASLVMQVVIHKFMRRSVWCAHASVLAQAQTLMLSTLFTGVLGVGGFYVLRAAGLFKQDVAELPSAAEAKRMLTQPRVRTIGLSL